VTLRLGNREQSVQRRRLRGRLLGLLLGLLLGSCRIAEPITEPVPERSFALVIPIYNEAGLEAALTTFKPHLRSRDRFMLVSGNTSGAVDVPWLNRAALELRTTYPDAPIYAATSGLDNVAAATREVATLIEAIVYIYEPNFPNQPEFSWDFDTTLTRFGEASEQINRSGFRAIGKPTGRPLLQTNLQTYSWDYGLLAEAADELFIQTQTYCKDSPEVFGAALDALGKQYRNRPETHAWIPQVTIDPGAPNGTTVTQARLCLEEAKARGLSGAVLWWSPNFVERAVAFIALMNADDAL